MAKMKKILFWCCLACAFVVTGCSRSAENKVNIPEEIKALAAEGIFNVYWYTEDDAYAAGTAFVMDSSVHKEQLLVTAYHFLVPEDNTGFKGSLLPQHVTGGEIYFAKDFGDTGAFLKSNVIIEDADVAPRIDKDVAAFTLHGGEGLKSLSLCTEPLQEGEKVYLLASLPDNKEENEYCVYVGEVISAGQGILYYKLDGRPKTNGASGAPIVNEKGEVVAIHIGGNPFNYLGHLASGFVEQINGGRISDIIYPDTFEAFEKDSSELEDVAMEYLQYEREEQVSSMFYKVQIEEIMVTDTLEGKQSEEGYKYVVAKVSLSANEDSFTLGNTDFALEWEDDYCEALESGITQGQLPDEFEISEEETVGDLVFKIPEDKQRVAFTFYDVYYDKIGSLQYGNYYGINLPIENWRR